MTTPPPACHACGIGLRPGARFCDSCGAPQEVSVAPAEYKQVTVLFCDVVRSMDVAVALGPERLREVMNELVNLSSAIVQRYGGTVDKFTGDGIMALFGAPIALENHALRACLAALDLQRDVKGLAAEVSRKDGLQLRLRVGLNSGQVIAGEVGDVSVGYTAIGAQVGMAQRMEAAAPPDGVLLSESTARLVEHKVLLGDVQLVQVKGSTAGVAARQLLSADVDPRRVVRREARLVGRGLERDAIAALLDDASAGRGAVLTLSGPAGIGKTRLAREAVALAQARGFDVTFTYSEAHTREIPFHVVARLLRAVFGLRGLAPADARARVRGYLTDAPADDLVLLDDLIGVRDPETRLPDLGVDARRSQLVDLIGTMARARTGPAVYVVEDAHWIDATSEAMLGELAAAVPGMRAVMIVTYRPEYRGVLAEVGGARAFPLEPLGNPAISELMGELLGEHSSVADLSAIVADRAAGNPFWVEEIVRELAERDELSGSPGSYVCSRQIKDIHVPPTVQAAIAARIDRLGPQAKRTLHAAAVIGARFDEQLLEELMDDVDLQPLLDADLIDRVGTGASSRYAFHHPLTQKVAYESQLRAARAELHRRIAAVLQRTSTELTGQAAAMIATQYQAAGDLYEAFDWHMRAATWYGARDIRAARGSWELARRLADALPVAAPKRLEMQIAPRALLCGSYFQVGGAPEDTGFEELRELADAAGDKRSLAFGMLGQINMLTFNSRHRDAAIMASELTTLVDAIGDAELVVGLSYAAGQAKWEAGEVGECIQLAQRVIDLASGDATLGDFVIGSPLSWAITLRGAAEMSLGRPRWRTTLDEGVAMAHQFDPATRVLAQLYRFTGATLNGAVLPDQADLDLTWETLELARQAKHTAAVAYALLNRASVLLHSPVGDRAAGLEALRAARAMIEREELTLTLRRMCRIESARELVDSGSVEAAIAEAGEVLAEQFATGELVFRGPATTVLVEALLARGDTAAIAEARRAVDVLAAVPTDPGFVLHALPELRLRALLAEADGDEEGRGRYLARFTDLARQADFAGYLAQAERLG